MHLLLRLNWISLFWLAKETVMCLHCNICVWSSKSYLSFSVACFELTVLKKERDGISAAPKKLSPEWGRIRNLGWTGYRLSPSYHPHLYLSLAQMSPVSSLRFIFLSSGFFFFFFLFKGPHLSWSAGWKPGENKPAKAISMACVLREDVHACISYYHLLCSCYCWHFQMMIH